MTCKQNYFIKKSLMAEVFVVWEEVLGGDSSRYAERPERCLSHVPGNRHEKFRPRIIPRPGSRRLNHSLPCVTVPLIEEMILLQNIPLLFRIPRRWAEHTIPVTCGRWAELFSRFLKEEKEEDGKLQGRVEKAKRQKEEGKKKKKTFSQYYTPACHFKGSL